jgi:hypothetical protein
MEFGVHLPLISTAGEQRSLDDLLAFTEAAHRRGARGTCWRRCSIVRWSSSAQYCRSVRRRNARAEKLLAYARAGAQRVFLWPLADERAQLEVFRDRVVPPLDGEQA